MLRNPCGLGVLICKIEETILPHMGMDMMVEVYFRLWAAENWAYLGNGRLSLSLGFSLFLSAA